MKFAKRVVDIAKKDGLLGKNVKLEKNICVLCKGQECYAEDQDVLFLSI